MRCLELRKGKRQSGARSLGLVLAFAGNWRHESTEVAYEKRVKDARIGSATAVLRTSERSF